MACKPDATPTPTPTSTSTPTPTLTPTPTPTPIPDLTAYLTAPPLSGKSIGHTSVVFRLELEGALAAAYKPRSHRGHTRYRGEIAAYRLARALGLSNVPPALPRSFPLSALRSALGPPGTASRDLLDQEAIPETDGTVRGAVIPWIPRLEFLALEQDPLASQWSVWLGPAGPPAEQRAMAAQISTMILFDYLTANWDRYSGGNVGFDRSAGTVLYIDNDGAFFDPPPPKTLASQLARLRRVHVFSRSFVLRLRALDPDATRDAMGDDAPGTPLLAGSVLAGLDDRRKAVLEHVDAVVATAGEDKALSLP